MHAAAQEWIRFASQRYFEYDDEGNVVDATMYHDPLNPLGEDEEAADQSQDQGQPPGQ